MTGIPSGTPLPPTITVSLDQIQNLQDQGKEITFQTPEQRTEFLNLVAGAKADQAGVGGQHNPTLEIPTPTNAAELGLLPANLDNAISTLPFSITDLFAMLHELGNELKKASRQARGAEQQMEVNTMLAAADKIKESAAFALAAGIVQGTMQIAGGLVSGIGAVKAGTTSVGGMKDTGTTSGSLDSLKQSIKNVGYTSANKNIGAPEVVTRGRSNAFSIDRPQGSGAPTASEIQQSGVGRSAPKTQFSVEQLQQSGKNAELVNQKWQAMSQILQGLGQVGHASLDYESKMSDADRAKLDALAKQMSYQVQSWDDMVKDMQSMMQDVRSKLGDMLQAQNQVASKIWS